MPRGAPQSAPVVRKHDHELCGLITMSDILRGQAEAVEGGDGEASSRPSLGG